MKNADRWYAWVDLETTGSDPDEDAILEVGIALSRADFEPSPPAARWVLGFAEPNDRTNPRVRQMHTDNGLWREVAESQLTLADADSEIDAWLRWATGERPRKRLIFSGSGVGHFDGRFIRPLLPKLDAWLTYWTIDVGVIRRFLPMAGIDVPDAESTKAHRALDDALHHMAEARLYRDLIAGTRHD